MDTQRDRMTYRVRQIPPHLDRLEVVRLLVSLDARLGPSDQINVLSLAKDLNARAGTQTATVMFDTTPSCFQPGQDEWSFKGIALPDSVLVDRHFRGFTVFNDGKSTANCIDCIAISGLGSHPFGSWRSSRDDYEFMWLRDRLPKDLPNVRSIIWGYDTQILNSQSFQTIEDLAMQLVGMLKGEAGKALPNAPSTIFLAHSLGGIILKQALVFLAGGDDSYQIIAERIQGIMHFGVPGNGMETSYLLAMTKGNPNEDLIGHLAEGSEYLGTLQKQYGGITVLRNIRLKSVHETQKSATAIVKKTASGKWVRKGPYEILVKPDSAIHREAQRSDIIPLNRDHSGMVKFSQHDMECSIVVSHLENLVAHCQPDEGIPQKISDQAGPLEDSAPVVTSPGLTESNDEVNVAAETLRLERLRRDFCLAFSQTETYRAKTDRYIDVIRTIMSQQSERSQISGDFLDHVLRQLQATATAFDNTHDSSSSRLSMRAIVAQARQAPVRVDVKALQWEKRSKRRITLKRVWQKIETIVSERENEDDKNILKNAKPSMRNKFASSQVQTRLADVKEAYQSTFKWVFEDTALGFARWLHNCEGLYWIQGKPGSGKSTLMKHIVRNLETDDIISKSTEEQYICANFFFHERGSYIEKSFEGLLSSIIGQIIGSDDRIADCIEPIYLEMALSRKPFETNPKGDLEYLEMVFEQILRQNEVVVRIYLFLDALDEYDGDKVAISDFLTQVIDSSASSRKTRICICFSSRPWPVFVDRFSRCPGFEIQRHTFQDIKQFTKIKLQDRPMLDDLLRPAEGSASSQCSPNVDMVTRIARKAQGVFLWAALVVEELLLATRDDLTPDKMLTILEKLPQELEPLYQRTLARIDQSYWRESYIMLEVLLRSDGDVYLSDFIGTLACSTHDEVGTCMASFRTARELVRSQRSITNELHRIETRCGGLIEVMSLHRGGYRIQFMHQTVKDFLIGPGSLQKALGFQPSLRGQNGYSFWAKYELVSIIDQFDQEGIIDRLASDILFSVLRSAEECSGLSQMLFLGYIFDNSQLRSLFFREMHSMYQLKLLFGWRVGLNLYAQDVILEMYAVQQSNRDDCLHLIADLIRICDAYTYDSKVRNDLLRIDDSDFTHWRLSETEGNRNFLSKLAKFLIECGGKVNFLNKQGFTPLDAIIITASQLYLERYDQLDVCRAISMIETHGGQVTDASKTERRHIRAEFDPELDQMWSVMTFSTLHENAHQSIRRVLRRAKNSVFSKETRNVI